MPLKILSKEGLFLLNSNMIVTKHLESIVFQVVLTYYIMKGGE